MNLVDILTENQIVLNLGAATRWEAIDELIDVLVSSGKIAVQHRNSVIAVVKKREQSMSTGIGSGVAIPHAATDLISEVVAVLGRSTSGVQFDSLDGQPVNLIVLFLVPQGHLQKHLLTLGNIAKLLNKSRLREAVGRAQTPREIFQIIRSEVDSK